MASVEAVQGSSEQTPASVVTSSQQQTPMVVSSPQQIRMVVSPQSQMPMVGSPQRQVPMVASPQHQVPIAGSPQNQVPMVASPQHQVPMISSPLHQASLVGSSPQQIRTTVSPQQHMPAVATPQQQMSVVAPPQELMSTVSTPQQHIPGVPTQQQIQAVPPPQQQLPVVLAEQQIPVVANPQQLKPAVVSPQNQPSIVQGTQQQTPVAMEVQNQSHVESPQQKHMLVDTSMVNSPSPSAGVYPAPLATHAEVVANRDLFYDTLNKFHAALGTRLMIPTIGGKELDLHVFYIEVSGRGGFDQVVKDRKWKEITVAFDFPPTTTSASFVLRKYYVMLLHHYEQVYYFGAKGPLVPPAVSFAGTSPGPTHTVNGAGKNGLHDKEKRRKKNSLDVARATVEHKVDLGASLGNTVSGFIDGKFEHGYLVTVTVGSELLRGVLYHMPSGSLPQQYAAVPAVVNGVNLSSDTNADARRRRRRRRKDEMPKKDPNAPKPNRSGYNFFFQEQHTRLRALHPDKDREISRLIGESWNKLTEEERAVYQEQGVRDKERYKREMDDYRRKLQSQDNSQVSGNVNSDAQDASENNDDVQLEETTFCAMDEKPIDSNSYVPSISEVDQLEFSGPSDQGITNNS